MPYIIREDKHSKYLRYDGFVFRPLFPLDYPSYTSHTIFATGQRVRCDRRPEQPLVVITPDFAPWAEGEVWFSHGSYYRPNKKGYLPSTELWKPEQFKWAIDKKMVAAH